MSAAQTHALAAVAFQLAATVDRYEHAVARLVDAPDDLELYHLVSRQVDDMRMYAAAFPMLAVAWAEVLIRHFELTHGIWRLQSPAGGPVDLRQLHGELATALQRLSRQLRRQMPSA